MLIKASGCFMEEAKREDFVGVGIDTLSCKQKSSRPSCEFRMHAFYYRQRPDTKCVIHVPNICYYVSSLFCKAKTYWT